MWYILVGFEFVIGMEKITWIIQIILQTRFLPIFKRF